jgi:hypothetical protein
MDNVTSCWWPRLITYWLGRLSTLGGGLAVCHRLHLPQAHTPLSQLCLQLLVEGVTFTSSVPHLGRKLLCFRQNILNVLDASASHLSAGRGQPQVGMGFSRVRADRDQQEQTELDTRP